jgi:choice-of-anchor C domain-containing protein
MLRSLTLGICVVLSVQAAGGAALVPARNPSNAIADASACPALAGGTGMLTDGDLSERSDPHRKLPTYKKHQSYAPDWTVAKGNINVYGTRAWGPRVGYCSVDLDGQLVGTVVHAPFATNSSTRYTVTFTMSGNGACGPTVKQMEVEAGDQSQQFSWDISSGHNANNGVWAAESWTFTADGSATQLAFVSEDTPKDNACGPVIADVAVNPVGSLRERP